MSQRVLLVDDEVHIRVSMGAFLEDDGFDVVSVASAEEALEVVQKQKFDVGVIDLRLPGMDGEKLILQLSRLNPAMCFLIHTGSSDFEITPELGVIGLGTQDIIKKPVSDLRAVANAIRMKCQP